MWTGRIILKKILPKMGNACYAVRSMYHSSSMVMTKTFYYAYFHSIKEYGIVWWGNSRESKSVFQLHKKIIRIMTGSEPRTSWKPLFQSLEILTLPPQRILSLLKFLSQNLEIYTFDFTVHGINTEINCKCITDS